MTMRRHSHAAPFRRRFADAMRATRSITACYEEKAGSPLFSMELEMGQAELACDKVKHSDEVFAGTIAASFAFGGLEHAVEPFHEGVGQPPFPMGQNAREVGLDHLCDLEHREEDVAHMLLGNPAHPTAPRQKAVSGCLHARQPIDVL